MPQIYITCLEQRMMDCLTKLNIPYDFEVPFKEGFICDFILWNSKQKVCIETDGKIWHNTPSARKCDGYKNHTLKKKGYIILRFGDNFTHEDVELKLKEIGEIC